MTNLFEDANLCAIHANRVTLMPKTERGGVRAFALLEQVCAPPD